MGSRGCYRSSAWTDSIDRLPRSASGHQVLRAVSGFFSSSPLSPLYTPSSIHHWPTLRPIVPHCFPFCCVPESKSASPPSPPTAPALVSSTVPLRAYASTVRFSGSAISLFKHLHQVSLADPCRFVRDNAPSRVLLASSAVLLAPASDSCSFVASRDVIRGHLCTCICPNKCSPWLVRLEFTKHCLLTLAR